jgi:dynactin complex subunit
MDYRRDSPSARITQLENHVESLRTAVKELAHLLSVEVSRNQIREKEFAERIILLESKLEQSLKIQNAQTRAIKKQDERMRKGFAITAEALSSSNHSTAHILESDLYS